MIEKHALHVWDVFSEIQATVEYYTEIFETDRDM